ncbi:MBOAT family O-acyltransferase [Breznakiella homolactica]|uniref:MBOAT family protein n=1 Tax=Breznakiella homolactica TaxID=2798577 RepID=A0A7T7XPW0_9SPIR|nr:MBOAT family O-acyltransferase [Breznakiella homolactica]QQO10192.1 MBOAT family protein [Breznakiella homolactica]
MRKIWLILALFSNLAVLLYFKYYDFFFININRIFGSSFALKHLLLPLGISFFTFQQLSYIIDSYRGEVPDYNFLDYALFVTYFPQLIAGPIVTHDEMVPQFADESKKRFQFEQFSKGLYAFAFGLAKKVLIADTFGNAVTWGYSNVGLLNSTNGILLMLFYTFQIYFDFSGYCDMATGIGKMFNIDITMNFNSPYRALTIVDFWKRWHITLTRFFTRYVYIPLGGNRKGQARTYLNTMIVFLISGLWHGANWTFVLWGFLHGAFSIITRIFKNFFDKLHPAFSWIITFLFINLSWIYFRADSISQANAIIKIIGGLNFGNIKPDFIQPFASKFAIMFLSQIPYIRLFANPSYLMIIFVFFAMTAVLIMKNTNERIESFYPTRGRLVVTTVLVFWCIVSFAGVSVFLYFNF